MGRGREPSLTLTPTTRRHILDNLIETASTTTPRLLGRVRLCVCVGGGLWIRSNEMEWRSSGVGMQTGPTRLASTPSCHPNDFERRAESAVAKQCKRNVKKKSADWAA